MTIGVAEALDALEKTVAKYGPNTRYEDQDPGYLDRTIGGRCRYVEGSKPLCIAGVVLVEELGVHPAQLIGLNNRPVTAVAVRQTADLTEDAARVLGEAQIKQDGGSTWGEALAAAKASGSLLVSA